MRREVFVAKTRDEAVRLCAPYLGAKYKAYHAWHQEDLPLDDNGFDQDFEALIGDRFLIGSADEVAEQILAIHRRLGVNHLVMSTELAGMPKSLVLDTIEIIARALSPASVRACATSPSGRHVRMKIQSQSRHSPERRSSGINVEEFGIDQAGTRISRI